MTEAASTPVGAPWLAPTLDRPVHATVTLPGSKSLTNRYLILAALAEGPSTIECPLRSRDTLLMADALRALGVTIRDAPAPNDAWLIDPPTRLRGPAHVDCGLAGTVMRFLPALAALATGPVEFDGDPHARERPMAPVLGALTDLGIPIDDDGRRALPFTVHGTGVVRGGRVHLDASASSQFISGLLLAAPRFENGLTVVHDGGPLPSVPHIEMTVAVLREAGAVVEDQEPNSWTVAPGPLHGLDLTVEPDLSNAGPFLAAALVTGGTISVPRWPLTTTQAGDSLRDLLDAMGADVRLFDDALHVSGTRSSRGGGVVHGVDADLHNVGELTPVIAAVAALADSPSRLTGIGHLRGHETDRLAALSVNINTLGGDVTELDDGLFIRPAPLHGGQWPSYADHRMATAGAVVGLRVPGVEVLDIATTVKTLPDFPGMWARMLAAPDHWAEPQQAAVQPHA